MEEPEIWDAVPHSADQCPKLLTAGTRPFAFAIACHKPETLYVHWDYDRRRSYPCIGKLCPCVKAPRMRVFKAYVSAVSSVAPNQPGRLYVVELTQSAYLCLFNAVPLAESWLGLVAEVWRTAEHRAARCEARILRTVQIDNPPAVDIRASLYRIWGYAPHSNAQGAT